MLGCLYSQLIAPLVFEDARVTPHPFELNLVILCKGQKSFPEVRIDRFLLPVPFPSIRTPPCSPTFFYAIDQILGITVKGYSAALFQCFKTQNRSY